MVFGLCEFTRDGMSEVERVAHLIFLREDQVSHTTQSQ
jgi:hypothetical protein